MSLACGVSHFMGLLRLVNLTWREACSTFPSVPSVRLPATFRLAAFLICPSRFSLVGPRRRTKPLSDRVASSPMPDNSPVPAPPVAAFDSGWLDVGQGHRVYYEQAGAAHGIPVVLLHGGPGSGSSPRQRVFYDHTLFRIVQFDQRGCGRSEPMGETAHNHTAALVGDIERLREHLAIDRWLVSGGSWGSTLALAYAARYR